MIQRGTHDELGAVPWVIVKDREGQEHYARLGFGQTAPPVGRTIELVGAARGAKVSDLGRGSELGR